MLQRLILCKLELQISSKHTRTLFSSSIRNNLCHECGTRLYFCHKVPVLRNILGRNFYNRNGLFNFKLRYYTTQVDTQKKNEHIESIKDKTALETTKKINVKLKTSELKRLFGLAEPEKWTLAGKFTATSFLASNSEI